MKVIWCTFNACCEVKECHSLFTLTDHKQLRALSVNPAASLSPKVVKKVLTLEFREMSELRGDIWSDEPAATDLSNPPRHPCRPPVNNIKYSWECFVIMASILVTRFPEKGPEFWAYQLSILRVAHNYYKGPIGLHITMRQVGEKGSQLCLTHYITRPL